MNKLYTTITSLFILIGLGLSAQVTITFQVDVSSYGDSATVSAEGMHIAGNLGDGGATIDGNAWTNWSPADGAMTDKGNGLWEIVVEFPSASAGDSILYKYVNGSSWGTNEGGNGLTDCGIDDGNGGFNRSFVVPAADETISVCYDLCVACNAVGVSEAALSVLNTYPNPATTQLNIDFGSLTASNATFQLINTIGQVVYTGTASNSNVSTIDVSKLNAGIYFLSVQNGEEKLVEKILIQ